ncbi:MAG TPA: glutaredoxin family protein [Burkholderiales bacterium]|nr:glutaredoxin family protein [Burkholderiales bacterium]
MRIVLLAGIVLAVSSAHAQMYRWVDKDGGTHYTQTPPPPDARGVEKKSLGAGAGSAAPGAMPYGELPYATQNAARNYPVTLYTSPGCGAPCEQARAVLVRRAVPFREVSVVGQQDIENLKAAGGTGLPHLVVGNLKQTGFSEESYKSTLDTAGYPQSGPRTSIEALRTMDAPAKAPAPAGGGATQEAPR